MTTDAPTPAPPKPTTPDPHTAATAKVLVMWSHILGWGGLALLLVGAAVAGATLGATAAAVTGGIGFLGAVSGAVIGQVGRAMQGRAI